MRGGWLEWVYGERQEKSKTVWYIYNMDVYYIYIYIYIQKQTNTRNFINRWYACEGNNNS